MNRRPSRAAFSMVEVLAVLAVIAVLMTLAVPGVLSILQASRLTTAADMVTARLNEARGLALAHSSDYEVRFFTAPKDPLATPGVRDAVQIYRLADPDTFADSETDAFVPAGPLEKLPEGIAFSLDDALSTLWQQPAPVPEGTGEEKEEDSDLELAAALRFHPDGGTPLPGTETWCVTLVAARERKKKELPVNFATITLDPATGRLETYRPR